MKEGRAQQPSLRFRILPSTTLDLQDLRRTLKERGSWRGYLCPRDFQGQPPQGVPRAEGWGIDRPSEDQTPLWRARNADTLKADKDKRSPVPGMASHTVNMKRGLADEPECTGSTDPWQARGAHKNNETRPLDPTAYSIVSTERECGVPPRAAPSPRPEIGPAFEDCGKNDPSLGTPQEDDPEGADVLEVDPSSTYAFEFFQDLKME